MYGRLLAQDWRLFFI